MATHTPGPWKTAHSTYANAPFVIYTGEASPKWDRRYPLTGVNWIAEVKHDESEQHEEQIANAHLIAVAPEMLATLKQLVEVLGHLNHAEVAGSECQCRACHIEALIAKAEGRVR